MRVLLLTILFLLSCVAGKAQTFNTANTWDFRYCSGMPSHPFLNSGGGWYFDFPASGGSVNYLTTVYESPITAKVISITAQIQVDNGATVNSLDTNGSLPASARFFIQRKGDQQTAPFELYRWWSNPIAVELKSNRVVVVSVALTPDQWSSVFGKFGNYNAITQAGFAEALNKPGNIGLTFGGGSSFGHGVYVSSGSARFTVINFSLTDGFSREIQHRAGMHWPLLLSRFRAP